MNYHNSDECMIDYQRIMNDNVTCTFDYIRYYVIYRNFLSSARELKYNIIDKLDNCINSRIYTLNVFTPPPNINYHAPHYNVIYNFIILKCLLQFTIDRGAKNIFVENNIDMYFNINKLRNARPDVITVLNDLHNLINNYNYYDHNRNIPCETKIQSVDELLSANMDYQLDQYMNN